MQKIGLIAGNRKFPLIFCEAAKKKNCYVVAIAIKKDTLSKIERFADKVYWLSLKEYSRIFEILKSEEIKKIVMAGQISPHRLFNSEINYDARLKKIIASIRDKKADTIFGAISKDLKDAGFELLDSTLYLEDFLPQKGTLTKRMPTFAEWDDIYFGLDLAKEIGLLDIGQTVAVKQRAVIAVEALEGTDNLILRAGKIARDGIIVVKVSKPNQDTRFDIPVVGLITIKNLIKVKAKCLAIEARRTLFIDKEQSIRLANKHNFCIVAV